MRHAFAVALLGLSLAGALQRPAIGAGTLFVGADTEEFSSLPLAQERLGKVRTDGATLTSAVTVENPDVFLNGLADSGVGTLYSGSPLTNIINLVSYDGDFISATDGPHDTSCCKEDLAYDGTFIWQAEWSAGPLFRFRTDGSDATSFDQTDVVGLEFVNGELWMSKWGARQVGVFDPDTNTFDARFNTLANAGGLAFDPGNNVLWVGPQGGTVEAWDVTDPQMPSLIEGSSFFPFGESFTDTVDGLAFIEDSQVPEPATAALALLGLASFALIRRRFMVDARR